MKTAKEVAEEFEFELKALLKKYGTQIEMEIVNQNYLGIEYTIKVYIPEVWKNKKEDSSMWKWKLI